MEHLNKIRLAAENQMRERAAKTQEALEVTSKVERLRSDLRDHEKRRTVEERFGLLLSQKITMRLQLSLL